MQDHVKSVTTGIVSCRYRPKVRTRICSEITNFRKLLLLLNDENVGQITK